MRTLTIPEYKKKIRELKHILRTDKKLDGLDRYSHENEIKEYKVKIANLKGMNEIKSYYNLSGFKRELVDLIFEAKKKDLEKLRKAYPELVKIRDA